MAAWLPAVAFAQAPAPSGVAVKPAAEKVLRFRLHGEPNTLDWNLAHTPYEIYLLVKKSFRPEKFRTLPKWA